MLARVGYGHSSDPGTQLTGFVVGGTPCISSSSIASSLPNFECAWGGAGATIIHKPTGLFCRAVGASSSSTPMDCGGDAIQPRQYDVVLSSPASSKWLSLGKTNIFGEYRRDDAGSYPGRSAAWTVEFWQAGLIQNIEAADASLYIVYEHADGDVLTTGSTSRTRLDAFEEIMWAPR